jgi:hypothetical protein
VPAFVFHSPALLAIENPAERGGGADEDDTSGPLAAVPVRSLHDAQTMPYPSTVRHATTDDVPAILDLIESPIDRGLVQRTFETAPPGSHLLVLDDGNGRVVAAALLSIAGDRGQLRMLVVSPDSDDARQLEERMLGVMEAMCEAFGARRLEVARAA